MDITRNPVSTTLSISSSARNCNGSSLVIPADPSWPKIPRRHLPQNYSGTIQQSTNCYMTPRKSRASLHHHQSPTSWNAKSTDTTAQINTSSASVSIADRLNHVLIRPPFTPKITQQSRVKRPAGCLDPRFHKQVTMKTRQIVPNQLTSRSPSSRFRENRYQVGELSNDIVNPSENSYSAIIPSPSVQVEKKTDTENSLQSIDSNYNAREKNCKFPAVNEDINNIDTSNNDVDVKTNKSTLTQSINHVEACEKILLDAVQSVNISQVSKNINRSISLMDLPTSSNDNCYSDWKDFKSQLKYDMNSEQNIERNNTVEEIMSRNKAKNSNDSEKHSRLLQRISQEKLDYHPADLINDSSMIIPMETQRLLNDSYLEYYNKLNSYQYDYTGNNNRKSQESTSSTTTSIINISNGVNKSDIRQTLDQCTALSSTMNTSVLEHQVICPITENDIEILFSNNQVIESFSKPYVGTNIVDGKDVKINKLMLLRTLLNIAIKHRNSIERGLIIIFFLSLVVIFPLMILILNQPIELLTVKMRWINLEIDDNTNNYYDFFINNYFVASFHAAFLQLYQLVDFVSPQSPLTCSKCSH